MGKSTDVFFWKRKNLLGIQESPELQGQSDLLKLNHTTSSKKERDTNTKNNLPKKFPIWMMQRVMLFRQRPYMEASQHLKQIWNCRVVQVQIPTAHQGTSDRFMTENHSDIIDHFIITTLNTVIPQHMFMF